MSAPVNRLVNPLYDTLPQKVRKIAYAVLFVAAGVYGIVQVSDGDWQKAGGSVLVFLVGLLASSNTAVTTP